MSPDKIEISRGRYLDRHLVNRLSLQQTLAGILALFQRMVVAVPQRESLPIAGGVAAQFLDGGNPVHLQCGIVRPGNRAFRVKQDDAVAQSGNKFAQYVPIDIRWLRLPAHAIPHADNWHLR